MKGKFLGDACHLKMLSDRIDIKINIKKCQNGLKKTDIFGYRTVLQCGENGFLHTEEGLYTRNVCVSSKTTFDPFFGIYFYINPIR